MSHPNVTIEAPHGCGRRAAIEWCVEHLIRILDDLNTDAQEPGSTPNSRDSKDGDDFEQLFGWHDPDSEIIPPRSPNSAWLTVILSEGRSNA